MHGGGSYTLLEKLIGETAPSLRFRGLEPEWWELATLAPRGESGLQLF